MILTICASNNRNAIVDGYVGLINHFQHKKELIAVIPGVCRIEEFHSDIRLVREEFRDKGKLVSKIQGFIFYLKLARLVRREQVEGVFIYSDSEWPNLIHLMIPTLRRLRTTVYIHDPKHHSGEQGIIRLIRRFAYPFYARHAVNVLSYEKAKKELVENHRIFKNARLVSVRLPNMSVMEFPDLREAVEKGQVAQDFDLIFFGRLEHYKGVDLLLQASLLMKAIGRPVKILILGGRGELKETVRKAAEQDPDVTFLDIYVSNRALADYITRSRAVILPYRDASGTQTVQIANYYYKPVIVNPTGCFDEYVSDGKNGFYIKSMTPQGVADTILETLEKLDHQDLDPQILRKTAEDLFDITVIAGRLEALVRGEASQVKPGKADHPHRP